MNIPTWKAAPGEGRRGLASSREKELEMLGRQRVRSGSNLRLGAVTHSSADLERCKGATN